MEKAKVNLPVVFDAIHQWDIVMFMWMMKRKHLTLWARLCRSVSKSADGLAYPILGLVAWSWESQKGALFAATLAMAFALERPLYLILKKGLKRNRPAQALPGFNSFIIPSDRFSFPSGHTSGAFATATAVSLFYPQFTFILFFWATLVGVSRITLGVHFPTDTMAGAVIGASTTLVSAKWIIQ